MIFGVFKNKFLIYAQNGENSMGTKQVDNSAVTATSTDNEGSAILGLNTDRNNAKSVTLSSPRSDVVGSRVTAALDEVTNPVAGAVAVNNDRGVILQVTETLANGTTTSPAGFLKLAAQDKFIDKTHEVEQIIVNSHTSGIRAGHFNEFGIAGQRSNFSTATHNITMAFGADSGVLTSGPTFNIGTSTPTQADYEAPTT